jgi:hypothetical protein
MPVDDIAIALDALIEDAERQAKIYEGTSDG